MFCSFLYFKNISLLFRKKVLYLCTAKCLLFKNDMKMENSSSQKIDGFVKKFDFIDQARVFVHWDYDSNVKKLQFRIPRINKIEFLEIENDELEKFMQFIKNPKTFNSDMDILVAAKIGNILDTISVKYLNFNVMIHSCELSQYKSFGFKLEDFRKLKLFLNFL